MARKLIAIVAFTVLGLSGAACSGGGGDSQAAGGQGEDGGGGAAQATAVPMPHDFPADFSIPEGAIPVQASAEAKTFSVWFASSQNTDEINAFFHNELSSGWRIDYETHREIGSGSYRTLSVVADGWDGNIYIGRGAPEAAAFDGEYAFFVFMTKIG